MVLLSSHQKKLFILENIFSYMQLQVQELLKHFSSTVFACDISGDTRYIRCDFPQCRQHAEALQGIVSQF